jgi:DNA helicase-2/ATP-dependent DNA helicase PcrA
MQYNEFKKKYDIRLNEQQEKALMKTTGPTLLLAVPGSGKTTVIVSRVGYMAYCCGIDTDSILTLTFTVSAAREMKERFLKKFQTQDSAKLHFSTIHSFCVAVINKCRKLYGEYIPALEPENIRTIRQVYAIMTGEYAPDNVVRELAQKLTYTKNMMFGESEISGITTTSVDFPAFYRGYITALKNRNAMDFDDQLVLAYTFLQKYPDLLSEYQEQYKYINVDEAQDTSLIQHKIIELLASKHQNIFMVGDENQSIYGFRAAYPVALLNFDQTYPCAEILYMETNYRSTKEIIGRANDFIAQNRSRFNKKMNTDNATGDKIQHTKINDISDQYRFLLKTLTENYKSNKSVAVLYRNNESALPLVDLLDRHDVPFSYRGDSNSLFFSHFIVSDILSLLSLAVNPRDTDAYAKIYYKLNLFLSKQSIEIVNTQMPVSCPGIFDFLQEWPGYSKQKTRFGDVAICLREIRGQKPYDAIQNVLSGLRYSKWIDKMKDEGNSEQRLMQKVHTMMSVAMECNSVPEYLERMKYLAEYKTGLLDPNLTLSTIHGSKGLEFDKVIIIDAYGGIFPSDSAIHDKKGGKPAEFEEEVRLFYVAVTRARRELEIVTAAKIFGGYIETSQFIPQILGEAIPLAPEKKIGSPEYTLPAPARRFIKDKQPDAGDITGIEAFIPGRKVRHGKFGEGFIVQIDGDNVRLMFGSDNIRTFGLRNCIQKGLLTLV